ncbi:MAG: choice-of-anchor Q domain-containing protein [Coleofasciculus sp. C1-SOL-03]|jgi:hypothetical protein|uniref:choice-of-anchor Q domain-containing protein n=1 Tax=Coleofasciculus sp. C1-SOL-03 TaxID=3069522 RepID=UPI0032FD123E
MSGNNGGGISNRENLTIINSTISGNTAETGGGIYNFGNSANGNFVSMVEVNNSTISGNSAREEGGGIYNNGGGVNVSSSTISENNAISGGGILNNIYATNSVYAVTINNTIISGNNGTNSDVEGNFISNGFNLIGDTTGSTGFENDLIEPDITKILDTTLADNGGSTLTHALVPASPAIDAGNNNDVPDGITTDQRGMGFNRIVDGNNDTIAIVDIGAFEVQQLPSTSVPEPSSILGLVGLVIIGTGSLLKRKLQNKS